MNGRVSRGYVAVEEGTVVSMLSGRIMTCLDFKELWVDEFGVHPTYRRQLPEKISCIVLNTRRGYPGVKGCEANGFRAKESRVFMAGDG